MVGKVIVVDDDDASASLVSKLLARHGRDVVVCHSAEEAVTRSLDDAVDLVSLDIKMPILDGFDVLNLIRSHEHTRRSPSVPIIAITGAVTDADRAAALAAGFAAHLSKPLMRTELEQVLGRVTTMRSELHRTRYSVDHDTIVERLEAVLAGGDRFRTIAGLTLSIERRGRDVLEQVLRDAYASHHERATQRAAGLIELAETIGATNLRDLCRALVAALARERDGFEHAAVLVRAELDRVVYTLRERVLH